MARKFTLSSDLTISLIVGGMILLFFIIQPAMLSAQNIGNVARQASGLAVLACGELLAVLVGGIDLSLGSIIGLTSVIAAKIVLAWGLGWGLVAGVLVGLVLGTTNGIFISFYRMPAMIVTLAMLYFARGAALIIAGGMPVERLPLSFGVLGKGALLGIPISAYIALIVFALCGFFLKYSRLGRAFYAIGGAEETSHLAGIRVEWVKVAAYALSGASAGLAGIILSSRISSGQANLGEGLEFSAIAAVVLGGARLGGGKGGIYGTALGVLFLAVLANGLNLARVSDFTQMVVVGCVLIITMIVDRFRSPVSRLA